MQVNWTMTRKALREIVALEHPCDRHLRGQLDEVERRELRQPFAVVANLGLVPIENFESLLLVGKSSLHHLLAGQARSQIVLPARVAYHRSVVANQENDSV